MNTRPPNGYLGKLIGNTGSPTNLRVALRGSFSARRGEFVRVPHTERQNEPSTDCLGRIVGISRSNILYSDALGEGVAEVNVLPGSLASGETLYATVELIGFKDAATNEIRLPRRPLDPGAKVYGVDYAFLRDFYQFSEATSIHLGNLVGYETGTEAVPIFLDVNTLATEHLAILAMTGSGKSYTVGRIIERLVAEMNGTVVVFDPHGEYGRAVEGGQLQTNPGISDVDDPRDQEALPKIVESLKRLEGLGGGIHVYTPQDEDFDLKYSSTNRRLALQFDNFDLESIGGILPGLTEPQMRVLDAAIRKWKREQPSQPRDVQVLIELLSRRLDDVRNDPDLNLTEEEQRALGARSAAIAGMRLRQLLQEAKAFYDARSKSVTDIKELIGRPGQAAGRLVIVDLQGLSDDARQIIVALLSSEILAAAGSKTDPTRPCFLVYEEGHSFAPAGGPSLSRSVIKKIAGEGRKFGVGFAIISQRPSKLDPDVTSQCNTLVTMRIKNPDDQRFIMKSTEQLSKADVDELPALSTGEALVSGRSIPAPLLVKVGYKALKHGGESPRILDEWGPGKL
jgi:DNA helicase HerA-like ATPase